MRWMRFRIKTNEQSEDIIISSLAEIGLEGAQIEDKVPLTTAEKEQMFIDYLPEEEGVLDDGIAFLNFFAELNEDQTLLISEDSNMRKTPDEMKEEILEILSDLRKLSDIGDGTLSIDVTEDVDWINNWKQYFHKFYIDEDVLVIPSWEKEDIADEKKAKYVLNIDPGTAFGTGMHETTQLCVKQLKKYITPSSEILDVGTGSGVLSILSVMFGAKHCFGTDIDPCSLLAVNQNMESNNIPKDKFNAVIGNIITDKELQQKAGYDKYDIVVANILPVILLPLTPVIVPFLKKGGVYITSGIIDEKEEEVKAAHEAAGFEIVEIEHQGEWLSITSIKH